MFSTHCDYLLTTLQGDFATSAFERTIWRSGWDKQDTYNNLQWSLGNSSDVPPVIGEFAAALGNTEFANCWFRFHYLQLSEFQYIHHNVRRRCIISGQIKLHWTLSSKLLLALRMPCQIVRITQVRQPNSHSPTSSKSLVAPSQIPTNLFFGMTTSWNPWAVAPTAHGSCVQALTTQQIGIISQLAPAWCTNFSRKILSPVSSQTRPLISSRPLT